MVENNSPHTLNLRAESEGNKPVSGKRKEEYQAELARREEATKAGRKARRPLGRAALTALLRETDVRLLLTRHKGRYSWTLTDSDRKVSQPAATKMHDAGELVELVPALVPGEPGQEWGLAPDAEG